MKARHDNVPEVLSDLARLKIDLTPCVASTTAELATLHTRRVL